MKLTNTKISNAIITSQFMPVRSLVNDKVCNTLWFSVKEFILDKVETITWDTGVISTLNVGYKL